MPISFSAAPCQASSFVDGGRVVHAVDDGDVLVVVEVFAELFESAVEVADMGGALDDSFAVEFQDQA